MRPHLYVSVPTKDDVVAGDDDDRDGGVAEEVRKGEAEEEEEEGESGVSSLSSSLFVTSKTHVAFDLDLVVDTCPTRHTCYAHPVAKQFYAEREADKKNVGKAKQSKNPFAAKAQLHANDIFWQRCMTVFILGIWNGSLFGLWYLLGWWRLGVAYLLVEFGHYVIYRARVCLLSEPVACHPPDMVVVNTKGVGTINRIKNLVNIMDPWDFVLPWFYHAEKEEIKLDNLRDLLAYGAFYATSEELNKYVCCSPPRVWV